MNLLAVIPAHNEAGHISGVVAGVKALGYDVLVVDDGSDDTTVQLAGKAGAAVISTGKKGGKGQALRRGFAYALERNYDAVITLDGDGQHDPAEIISFVQCRRATGVDVVNGNRMHNPKGMPALRLVTNAFMSWLISLICRQRIADTQCGFRLLTAKVLKNLQLECADFEIETELLVKASRQGFKIASVPVATIYSDEVSKINPLRDTVRFIRYIIRAMAAK